MATKFFKNILKWSILYSVILIVVAIPMLNSVVAVTPEKCCDPRATENHCRLDGEQPVCYPTGSGPWCDGYWACEPN